MNESITSFKGSSYDEKYKSVFMTARQKAEERNTRLMGELDELHKILKKDSDHREKKANFNSLKNNYWSMVKSAYPIWQMEMNAPKNEDK